MGSSSGKTGSRPGVSAAISLDKTPMPRPCFTSSMITVPLAEVSLKLRLVSDRPSGFNTGTSRSGCSKPMSSASDRSLAVPGAAVLAEILRWGVEVGGRLADEPCYQIRLLGAHVSDGDISLASPQIADLVGGNHFDLDSRSYFSKLFQHGRQMIVCHDIGCGDADMPIDGL